MRSVKKLTSLFFAMLKIGLFTFGGGYAMLALLESELVSKKGWLEREEFLDMVVIAESNPGPVAVNSAAYVGYRLAGVGGALAATFAVCLPAFVILFVISFVFDAFLSLTLVDYAFRGIRVAVVYLIFSAGVKMLRVLPKKPMTLVLFALSFAALFAGSLLSVNFSSIFYIFAGGLAGLSAFALSRMREKSVPGRTGRGSDDLS